MTAVALLWIAGGGCAHTEPTRSSPRLVAANAEAPIAGEPPQGPCPERMILAEGEYCPRLVQRCLRWMDPPGMYHQYRCAEYAKTPLCLGGTEHKRFCIDRFERTEPGGDLPLNVQAWVDAKRVCESQGGRVCRESEWNFACEGEEQRPYPYGWSRDAALCNADRMDLLVPGDGRTILDHRTPASAHPECLSAVGAQGMAGNVAEWVSVDGFEDGQLVVQKGNWWQPGKHACRDAQGGHDKSYKGTETGFRCCADAR